MEWICNKCKVDMEKVDDINVFYAEVDLPNVGGYRCPKCKDEYVSKEQVVEQLYSTEEMLEGK